MKRFLMIFLSLLLAMSLLSCAASDGGYTASDATGGFERADGEVFYVGKGFDVYDPEGIPLPDAELLSEDFEDGFHRRHYKELTHDELEAYFYKARDAGFSVMSYDYNALIYSGDEYAEVWYTEDAGKTLITTYGGKETIGVVTPEEARGIIGLSDTFLPVDITPREVSEKYGVQFFIQPFETKSSGYNAISSSMYFISCGRANEMRCSAYVIADADSDGVTELWCTGFGPTSGLFTLTVKGYARGILRYYTCVNLEHGYYEVSENDGALCFADDAGGKYGIYLNRSSGMLLIDPGNDAEGKIEEWGDGNFALYEDGDWLGLPSKKDHVKEFLQAYDEKYGGDAGDICNVTPRGVFEETGVRFFKFSGSGASFAFTDGEIYEICDGSAGLGFLNAVPWDYDGEGTPDLVIGVSYGKEVHQSEISVFDTVTHKMIPVASSLDFDTSGITGDWMPLSVWSDNRVIIESVRLSDGADAFYKVERVGEVTSENGAPVFNKLEY